MTSALRPSPVTLPLACCALMFCGAITGLAAVESDTFQDEWVAVQLGSSIAQAAPGERIPLVLVMRPIEGWHLYWDNPGDSGMPPALRWELPDGVKQTADWLLPPPEHLIHAGMGTLVLENEVLISGEIQLPEDFDQDHLDLSLAINWLICDDERCLPGNTTLELRIPVAQQSISESDGAWAARNERAAALKPQSSSDITLEAHGDAGLALSFPSELLPDGHQALLAPNPGRWMDLSKPQEIQRSDQRVLLPVALSGRDKPEQLSGLLVILDAEGTPSLSYQLDLPFPH